MSPEGCCQTGWGVQKTCVCLRGPGKWLSLMSQEHSLSKNLKLALDLLKKNMPNSLGHWWLVEAPWVYMCVLHKQWPRFIHSKHYLVRVPYSCLRYSCPITDDTKENAQTGSIKCPGPSRLWHTQHCTTVTPPHSSLCFTICARLTMRGWGCFYFYSRQLGFGDILQIFLLKKAIKLQLKDPHPLDVSQAKSI